MNIQPLKTDAVQAPPKTRSKAAPNEPESPDAAGQEKTSRKERLAEALANEPSIRPEVLDRAKELASDPDYPGPNLLAKLAARFIQDGKRAK